jgi:GTPase SAR1 family protein
MKCWIPEGMDKTSIYLWDFAGQEIYYTTHQFFLTENSINILVFKLTNSLEENKLLFWLNSIQVRKLIIIKYFFLILLININLIYRLMHQDQLLFLLEHF